MKKPTRTNNPIFLGFAEEVSNSGSRCTMVMEKIKAPANTNIYFKSNFSGF
jgi:hypothetical protein